jgi:hypothetical protein
VTLPRVVVALVVLGALMVGLAQITGRNGAKPHPLGTEVEVGHVEYNDGQRAVSTQIGLAVLGVRKGSQQQLAAHGLRVGADDRDATPYYIDARFSNKGPNAVKRNLNVGLEDSDGKLVRWTLILGDTQTFEPCRNLTEGVLEPGESYESCTLVLVPEGVDVAKVHFLSDNGPDEPPQSVYWAFA